MFEREEVKKMFEQTCVSVVAVIAGLLLARTEPIVSKLLMFFGGQTFMNIYMKNVLSNSVVSVTKNLHGIPAPFMVTAIQQSSAFVLIAMWCIVSRFTPWGYMPRLLTEPRQWVIIILLSFCFAMNIGLNNLSLSLLDISVNIVIRGCSPITAFVFEALFARICGDKTDSREILKLSVMAMGTVCACAVVHAKKASIQSSDHMGIGIPICVCSIFAASMELVVVKFLGTSAKLNPVDAICYMALPCSAILMIASFSFAHTVTWPDRGPMCDWDVISEAYAASPGVFVLVFLSGAFALGLNVVMYSLAQSVSATFVCMTSNFNKVATICIALILGIEKLPAWPYSLVLLLAIAGNACSFGALGFMATAPTPKAEKSELPDEHSPLLNKEQAKSPDKA